MYPELICLNCVLGESGAVKIYIKYWTHKDEVGLVIHSILSGIWGWDVKENSNI